ncbi:PhaM family polyhydroxyalkanoate granule multifunctional regulatory protein [Accumulibacter sp.]|jgi:hypothetical protein|uniref:PhaM family polyhydroxyalkanoate granule multifunctional regulatory protein n=1 Tax=Accumulibacter sp. TaxID=2053492 RepID=UPI001AD4CA5E|nr:PhaM family polyhydroxyalkanoate granule multifunctional regulatory protein [Accumulibacter sp.]MBN8451772.1 hypothetical protein [Accumulibacter sp.]MBO3706769.1 hypothetical protein [Candidatus Accumulibacter conexus]
MSNLNSVPDPLSFARKMWGSMGVSLPGMVTPTLNVEDIEKKIRDLKAVENWLKMNLSMLQMTIQGLEMQCVTLNAVRAMGQMAGSYGTAAGATDEAQGGSLVEPGSSNEALRQAALWPLTLLQQMQEQMQKAATAAVQSRQAQEEPPKT